MSAFTTYEALRVTYIGLYRRIGNMLIPLAAMASKAASTTTKPGLQVTIPRLTNVRTQPLPPCHLHSLTYSQNAVIPKEKYTIDKPVLFIGCLQDAICVFSSNAADTRKYCTHHTIKEIDATHWAFFSDPEKVTQMLLEWVEKL